LALTTLSPHGGQITLTTLYAPTGRAR
jgi:hypothetical protein